VDDMVLLSKLKEDEIMENLRKRHQNDVIYTYISNVLISVNPFKIIPGLSDLDQVEKYRGKFRHELPPHIFALAEAAYRGLTQDGESQCVIISGESGAGKTEAAKLIMQYIAAVSGSSSGVERVKKIILESNPLLEAFGNAKTVRNNNSSRFGKYFEIQFDKKGDPIGGRITNYLLEKSRVVYQSSGERNFHIFYQICSGSTKEEQEKYGTKNASDFYYLSQSGCFQVDNIDDVQDFKDVKHAMDVIGITKQEQENIFSLVAGILWLGNVRFAEQGGRTVIANDDVLTFTASLLGVSNMALQNVLLFRVLQTGMGGKRGSTYNVPQTPDQAAAIRDALAKALYNRLFDWLVQRVNDAMDAHQDTHVIGVLDIFGFEIFEKNGFEQFCINYVNEKLQQIFIDLTLKAEQEEYNAEKIKWEPIDYFNNKIVCDLIEETKPPGVFSLLDDTCSTTHSMENAKADEKFLQRLKEVIDNPHFASHGRDEFVIKHYAGNVTYNIDGFTEKNKDTLYNTLIECMQSSNRPFIRQFFPENTKEDSKKKPTTSGFKIKKSCQELVIALKKCQPHYIRCIKPNETKRPRDFDTARVLHQVKYLGLLENIRVRRAGWAFRCPFERFLERFDILSKKTFPNPWRGPAKEGCKVLLEDIGVETKEWQLGITKIFLRQPETLFGLEEMKERKYHDAATVISRAYRTYKMKKYFLDLRAQASDLLMSQKQRRRLSLNRVFQGDYINYSENAQLQEVMKQFAKDGNIVFADIFMYPVKKMLKKLKIEKYYGLVTPQAIYFIERKKVKKQFIMQLVERITWSRLNYIGMSQLADNWLVIGTSLDSGDFFVETDKKTEFLAVLNDQYKSVMQKDVERRFSNSLEFVSDKKKKSKKVCVFVVHPEHKLAQISASGGSKFTVTVAEGLPANSRPRVIAKQQQQQQPQQKSYGNGPRLQQQQQQQSSSYQPSKQQQQQQQQQQNRPPQMPQIQAPQMQVQSSQQQQQQQQRKNVGIAPSLYASAPRNQSMVQETERGSTPVKKLPPPLPKKDNRIKLRAMYDYTAAANDELSFSAGDILYLCEGGKDPSGWWELTDSKGRVGLAPGNYVQEI
jgi:myosin-1